ncbi:MAG TPA: M14 family metallopeptidase, partial [Sediminibacterium sp.]|nr:M14 family metallopeptidase [Sediminibacterium sp.]
LVLGLLCACSLLRAQNTGSWPASLQLTPEKSAFDKTSTYADVMQFLDTIQTLSPLVKISSMGSSPMGKSIPFAILAKPAITSPEAAKASGKLVVYIQGNIHAGEVEGKESVMMLMRDILLGNKQYLLQHLVILFAPIYNTDGNDKMAKGLRPTQENSPLETGVRENGQGLDLNRDGIKLEAPETRGLIQQVILPWDPQLFVDLHTTNGSWHGYSLTWAPSYLSAGEAATYHYTNDRMLPAITKTIQSKYGLYFAPYGDENLREGWPPKNFYTYNHHPRYLVNQFGLRNRMAILSEAFAHDRFYQRINSTYDFVSEILDYCDHHANEIMQVNHQAEKAAIRNVLENAGKQQKGVRFKMVPTKQPIRRFRTYDYQRFTQDNGSSRLIKLAKIITLDSVTYYGAFRDTVRSTLPRGYIIPAEQSAIAKQLQMQGIRVDTVQKEGDWQLDVFTIDSYTRLPRKFEGHFMASAEGRFQQTQLRVHAGDFIVDMAQPLTNLAFYMLEPQSDDGLLTWNFFDAWLDAKGIASHPVEYPVYKFYQMPAAQLPAHR